MPDYDHVSLGHSERTVPLVSVLTVTKNSQLTIKDCLSSVDKQTYPNIEHIVVDGSSDDDTLNLVSKFKRPLGAVLSEPDKGIYDALNKALKLANGEIIGLLHSDDVFADNTVIEAVVDKMVLENVDGVYGNLVYVAKNNKNKVMRTWISSQFSPEKLHMGWMPPHPTLFLKESWYNRLGGFDDSYRISADYKFILQLFSSEGFSVAHLSRVLTVMSAGGVSNNSFKNIICKMKEDWSALEVISPDPLPKCMTLVMKNLSKIKQLF